MGRLKEQDIYPAVEGITPDVSILLSDGPSCSLATGLPHCFKHTVLSFSSITNYCTNHNCCTSLTASRHRLSVADHRLHGDQLPRCHLYRPASQHVTLFPKNVSKFNVEPQLYPLVRTVSPSMDTPSETLFSIKIRRHHI